MIIISLRICMWKKRESCIFQQDERRWKYTQRNNMTKAWKRDSPVCLCAGQQSCIVGCG